MTLAHAGVYPVTVDVRDAAGADSRAAVDVIVAPVAMAITIDSPPGPLAVASSYTFRTTVTDQFGDPMPLAPAPVWNVTPKALIDVNGTFYPQQTGEFTITATIPAGPSASRTVAVSFGLLNITRSAISRDSVTIQWTTTDAADSRIEYGFDTGYGTPVSDTALTRQHSLVLTGLTPGRIYHYRVRSKNAAGSEVISGDLTFTTRR
jgi:hypothetical protein